ncbi:transglutaminase-like domain-containing protein [Cellulomonas wangsupingiae]|uniref:Transglutaminase family protein n=1 Tax=Cellulomonas wangsupingiae TaxID=2968085 RepID=A0ABY5KAM8_9CELL|nr:transglutaminase family protein [Cellulomonas wangsupingiae]MCC2333112.1 transglutaminase family protein [Cellulomonas wangsupingiae]MCM0640471.1 transglutaminase family protein [Cellulomonas wangsupingiae]UUI66828.1 transglutaminase family protein [Cellulomonas wangsupingiae]
MQREMTAHLVLDVTSPARLVLEVAVAGVHDPRESLAIVSAGRDVVAREVVDPHGTRLHVVDVGPGLLTVDYRAEVTGRAHQEPDVPADQLVYLRPSRYCESDVLAPTARSEFRGLAGVDLLAAVSSWVGTRLAYAPGSSLPTDGAVRTLLARRGVCRDFAHLVVALLRALDVPARLVAVYAPGLDPMDFHAVAEAYVEGRWRVVDATTLAPRSSLVRIATGRDASDTAFLSVHRGTATLRELTVSAVADTLPDDDVRELVSIG